MTGRAVLLFAFLLSGATALVYEIVWIKLITTVYSSTTYVSGLVLACFMAGLALGSGLAHRFLTRTSRPLFWYAIAELAIGAYGVLLLALFGALPIFFARLLKVKTLLWYHCIEFSSIALLLLLPTALMGATFPLIAHAYPDKRIQVSVGEVYGINNLGAVLGALGGGLLLIPLLGISYTVLLAAFLNVCAASLVLLKFYRSVKPALLALVLIVGFHFTFGGYSLVGLYSKGVLGLFKEDFMGDKEVVFYKEGLHGFVSVWREGQFKMTYRLAVNGQGSSSTRLTDMRISTLLAYLPLFFKPDAERAMVVGFGTGVSSGILARNTTTITVEIEPEVVAAAPHFAGVNNGVLQNPRHKVVYDDARHFLKRSAERYDIILNHPLEPFQSFSSLLFTKEFLEIARSKLSDDGIYAQWFPIYDLTAEDFRRFYSTFRGAFPYHAAFVNTAAGERIRYVLRDPAGNQMTQMYHQRTYGTELILIASKTALPRIDDQFFAKVYRTLSAADLEYLGMTSLEAPQNVAALFLFNHQQMQEFAPNARIITDTNPLLEFSTPLNRIRGVSGNSNPVVLDDISRHLSGRAHVAP